MILDFFISEFNFLNLLNDTRWRTSFCYWCFHDDRYLGYTVKRLSYQKFEIFDHVISWHDQEIFDHKIFDERPSTIFQEEQTTQSETATNCHCYVEKKRKMIEDSSWTILTRYISRNSTKLRSTKSIPLKFLQQMTGKMTAKLTDMKFEIKKTAWFVNLNLYRRNHLNRKFQILELFLNSDVNYHGWYIFFNAISGSWIMDDVNNNLRNLIFNKRMMWIRSLQDYFASLCIINLIRNSQHQFFTHLILYSRFTLIFSNLISWWSRHLNFSSPEFFDWWNKISLYQMIRPDN